MNVNRSVLVNIDFINDITIKDIVPFFTYAERINKIGNSVNHYCFIFYQITILLFYFELVNQFTVF